MALNLDQTLSWTKAIAGNSEASNAEVAMLNDLQGNILKGHGRHYTLNFFLSFDRAQQDAARGLVRALGAEVTTALEQLVAARVHKATGIDAKPFSSLFLTADGYRALGLAHAMPQGVAFVQGMKGRPLNDPEPQHWDQGLAGEVHALLIVGVSSECEQRALETAYQRRFDDSFGAVRVLAMETGVARFNKAGDGIEHFGYVDGRSQPLALQEDLDREVELGGIDQWNPAIPLSQLLVKCPGGEGEASCGSYFVFRKLEQDVQGFKRREIDLAEMLQGADERAGASVVGRFENGTPVTLSAKTLPKAAPGDAGLMNNFDYRDDPAGLKCPFAGHIRKTNPRNDTNDSKTHLMARRGIPYGTRSDEPNDGRLDNKPSGGVGLLFMAYQGSLENQFEFTQRLWANNRNFVQADTGIDPLIGQAGAPGPQRYPKEYGVALTEQPFDFSGFVRMRGGAYFFAPSVSFLKRLS